MNLYEKLVEVRRAVPFLKKDAQGFNFKYTSSSQVLGALREAMDKHGLLLTTSVIDFDVSDHLTEKKKHEYFTEMKIKYVWINAEKPTERLEFFGYGQGLDSGEKGVGKALTYSEKYGLLKFFNVPTDKDDPDSFQQKNETRKQTTTKTETKTGRDLLTLIQLIKRVEACKAKKELENTWKKYLPDIRALSPDDKKLVEAAKNDQKTKLDAEYKAKLDAQAAEADKVLDNISGGGEQKDENDLPF